MNWKRLLLIAAVVGAFTFTAAPQSKAGVRVGIGIGFPIGYGYCGYPYAGYPYPYGYPYAYGYPYGYAPYYASFGFAPIIHTRPVVVFHNGHRVIRHHPR